MRKYLLSKDGNFYKANLHSHSNVSDGRLSPKEIKEHYMAHGYSVVAYTDHDVFIPHHELTDDTFLALSGFEVEFNEDNIYPGHKHLKACHLCFIAKSKEIDTQPCWNAKYAYIGNAEQYHNKVKFDSTNSPFERVYSPKSINEIIKAGSEAGFFVTYNHPAWSLENYEQYINYNNVNAMEILNYACEMMGYPSYAPNVYDDMLRAGKRIFAVAADDNHNWAAPLDHPRSDSCGGYVMIKADELKYEAITDALFRGDFYASSGPEIYDLYVEDGKIYVNCSDAVMVTLNTGCRSAQSAVAEKDKPLNSAVFSYNEDDVYLRITVKDLNGNYAFSNAFFLDSI